MFRTSSVHLQERFVQAVFGNTRTAGHVQPLRLCFLLDYIYIKIVVIYRQLLLSFYMKFESECIIFCGTKLLYEEN